MSLERKPRKDILQTLINYLSLEAFFIFFFLHDSPFFVFPSAALSLGTLPLEERSEQMDICWGSGWRQASRPCALWPFARQDAPSQGRDVPTPRTEDWRPQAQMCLSKPLGPTPRGRSEEEGLAGSKVSLPLVSPPLPAPPLPSPSLPWPPCTPLLAHRAPCRGWGVVRRGSGPSAA